MEKERVEMKHFSHEHPLVLKQDGILYESCSVCTVWYGSRPHYVCEECRFYIHKDCAEMAQKINHPFHHSHPLFLLTDSNSKIPHLTCDSCHAFNSKSAWYGCDQCDFYMDHRCATMEPMRYGDGDDVRLLRHFSHQHPMELIPSGADLGDWKCFMCRWTCSGVPTYACKPCFYLLHKSCVEETPLEIEHPFHPHHPLSLCVARKEFRCKLCAGLKQNFFAYECRRCSLFLCVKCGADADVHRARPFECGIHEHPLYFVEKLRTKLLRCSGYETYCTKQVTFNSDELDRTCSSVLRCLECDFTLHLLCGPLPSTIKHDCHVDPLSLVDWLVEDDDYPDGEWYCDVCENKRNPRVCVYYCKDCKFIAHVHCVVSEIVKVLKGGVTLTRTVAKDITTTNDGLCESFMTLKDVIDRLTALDRSCLELLYKWDHNAASSQLQGDSSGNIGDKDIERTLKLCRFTAEDFNEFIEEYCWKVNATYEFGRQDLVLKVVEVEGYTIPITLAQVLRALIGKYGDVSDQRLGKKWNSLMYFILCKVMKQMETTKVVDITLSLIQEWYHHLKFVRLLGWFRIYFALAHFEGLARAFLGSQANRLDHEIPEKINQRIKELQQEIKEKHEAVSKNISGLKICSEYRSQASPKSDFMKECESKAKELKWKNASQDLFTHSNEANLPLHQSWRRKYEVE